MINAQLRKTRICPSESGAIFGCHPYLDQFAVWARKKADLPEIAPSPRMIAGKFFEEAILKLYGYTIKREVEYFDQTLIDPQRDWLAFTPDGLVRGERRGVDAKLIAWDQRRYWGHQADEIPQYIQFQVHCYMAALDYPVWDVAAMIGDELRIIHVPRLSPDVERAMLARLREWHQRYIAGDERPDMGASATAGRWLQAIFPKHQRPDLRDATPEEVVLLNNYAQARFEERAIAERKGTLENLLKASVADKEGLVWPDGKFTWRRTKDSKKVKWEALCWALLTHYCKDEAERVKLLTDYTETKEGYRRIRFEHDDLAAEDSAAA